MKAYQTMEVDSINKNLALPQWFQIPAKTIHLYPFHTRTQETPDPTSTWWSTRMLSLPPLLKMKRVRSSNHFRMRFAPRLRILLALPSSLPKKPEMLNSFKKNWIVTYMNMIFWTKPITPRPLAYKNLISNLGETIESILMNRTWQVQVLTYTDKTLLRVHLTRYFKPIAVN